MQGSVIWFNTKKGYGFIKPDGGGQDIFVHYSQINQKGFKELHENDHVEFEVGHSHGKQQAENVRLLD